MIQRRSMSSSERKWPRIVATPRLAERLVPGLELPMGLGVASAKLADGAGAEAEQVHPGLGGVAHEVAAQGALPQRHRELVVGPGEMIESDEEVALLEEAPDGQKHDAKLGSRIG